MELVGVKELKARLSHFVERAASGEVIIITHRGRQVATLGPVSPARVAAAALVAGGRAEWSGGKPANTEGVPVRGRAVAEIVAEDRR